MGNSRIAGIIKERPREPKFYRCFREKCHEAFKMETKKAKDVLKHEIPDVILQNSRDMSLKTYTSEVVRLTANATVRSQV